MTDRPFKYSHTFTEQRTFIPLSKWRFTYTQLLSPQKGDGDITPFQALTTSMGSSLGTGSLVGVAMAIAAGGPGAVFWMVMTLLVSSIVKYAEGFLSTKYRTSNELGEKSGGPMYYIEQGLKEKNGGNWHWLASLFAIIGLLCSLSIGNMIQSHSVIQSLHFSSMVTTDIAGAIFTSMVALIILGGVKSIGKITSHLIPIMGFIYISCTLLVLIKNAHALPSVVGLITSHAFTKAALSGGLIGTVVRYGIVHGALASEAGFGSSSIAHAASTNDDPVVQGMINSIGVIIGPLLISVSTALVILLSGLVKLDPISGGTYIQGHLTGAALTTMAFDSVLPQLGGNMVRIALLVFSITAMISWYYYGAKCLEYLVDVKSLHWYKWIWIGLCFTGTLFKLDSLWVLSGVLLSLMAIPNLIALLSLTPLIFAMTEDYEHVSDSLKLLD